MRLRGRWRRRSLQRPADRPGPGAAAAEREESDAPPGSPYATRARKGVRARPVPGGVSWRRSLPLVGGFCSAGGLLHQDLIACLQPLNDLDLAAIILAYRHGPFLVLAVFDE